MRVRWIIWRTAGWSVFLALGLRGAAADVGTYTARVTAMDGTYGLYNPGGAVLDGTYRLPVVIEDDEVTRILWVDGRRIDVTNGTLHGLRASAMSYQGQRFLIDVIDDSFHREDTANDSVSDSQPDDD
jgi:hypothetical protein